MYTEGFYYSAIALIAIIVHIIVNRNFYKEKDPRHELKSYRQYLISVFAFFVADFIWGILLAAGKYRLLFYDTELCYLATSFAVAYACEYVAEFLHLKGFYSKAIRYAGRAFCIFLTASIVYNTFDPAFFLVNEVGDVIMEDWYVAGIASELILFVTISVSAYIAQRRAVGAVKNRNRVLIWFGVTMTATSVAQSFFDHLPMLTIGFMFCSLFVFIYVYKEELNLRLEENHQLNLQLEHNLARTEKAMEQQEVQLNEIRSLNAQLEENQAMLEESAAEQEAQLEEIQTLNGQLNSNNAELQKMNEQQQLQLSVISTLSYSYICIYVVDLVKETFRELTPSSMDEIAQQIGHEGDVRECLKLVCQHLVTPEYLQATVDFTNMDTLPQRLKDNDIIKYQFYGIHTHWSVGEIICVNRDEQGNCTNALFCVRSINEEIQREQELQASIAANEAKTKFLQNMSHEIRTPLNAMFGFSQLLGMPDGMWSEEEKAKYNEYIYNSFNMMDMLISDILDISDSENGNYHIEISDVSVNEACRNALMSVEYRRPGLVEMTFTTDFADDYTVRSDFRRIQQVLVNYLSNACKNTLRGTIHLHCSKTEHPGKVTFSVADTGCGVPPEKAHDIFNRFTKLNQHVQGSGLGLHICSTIADKLDGEVYLDSTYTQGARFVFVINAHPEELTDL